MSGANFTEDQRGGPLCQGQNLLSEKLACDPYPYRPLDPGNRETRVIQVQASLSEDGLLQSDMHHISFEGSERPPYEALSYMWGDASIPQRHILVNGAIMAVGQNLWDFLNNARLTRPGRSLWIDAVCIDQTSAPEKEGQIRLMREIYALADQVLIWLGSDDDRIMALMQVAKAGHLPTRIETIMLRRKPSKHHLGTLGEVASQEYQSDIIDESSIPGVDRPKFVSEEQIWTLLNASYNPLIPLEGESRDDLLARFYYGDDVLLHGTTAINEHPYWQRAWIVQELLLTSKRRILCGTYELDWRDFDALMILYHFWTVGLSAGKPNQSMSRPLGKCRVWEFHRDHTHSAGNEKPVRLLEIMHLFQESQCTYPHDHVYGFLAMSEHSKHFPVSYDCGRVELLLNTLALAISEYFRSEKHWLHEPIMTGKFEFVTSTTDLASALAQRLSAVPLISAHNVRTLSIPEWSEPVCCSLSSMRWRVVSVGSLLAAASNIGPSESAETQRWKGIVRIFGAIRGRHRHLQQFFAEDDLALVDASRLLICITRLVKSERRIIGWVAGDASDGAKHDGQYIACETYGSCGLHGATVKIEEKTREESDEEGHDYGPVVGFLTLVDPRAALILFGLPRDPEFRATAIDMLYDVRKDIFQESCFLEHHALPSMAADEDIGADKEPAGKRGN